MVDTLVTSWHRRAALADARLNTRLKRILAPQRPRRSTGAPQVTWIAQHPIVDPRPRADKARRLAAARVTFNTRYTLTRPA